MSYDDDVTTTTPADGDDTIAPADEAAATSMPVDDSTDEVQEGEKEETATPEAPTESPMEESGDVSAEPATPAADDEEAETPQE